MLKSFRNKALALLWQTGKSAKIDARLHERILSRLEALESASRPEDMNLPGFNFHALRGTRPVRYTVHVNGPWCITFGFQDGDAVQADLSNITDGETLMTEHPAKRDPKRPPMHPGKLLREDILPAIGRPKTEIARLLGISRKTLYDILDEKQPVTPAMALRLGKLCGNGPMLWLNLQVRHDLWQATQTTALSQIPTLRAA